MEWTQQEIETLIDRVRAIFRATRKKFPEDLILNKKTTSIEDRYAKLPPYTPVYIPSVKHADHLAIHIDGEFPLDQFLKTAPNQTAEELKYQIDIYKPITESTVSKTWSAIAPIFNPMNFSIEWDKVVIAGTKFNDFPPQNYFDENYPEFGSLLYFFSNIELKFTIKDPNAVLAVKPRNIEIQNDRNEDDINDDSLLVEPVTVIYPSLQKIEFKSDNYCLVELSEKSVVIKNGEKERIGFIYEFYDTVNIWRIEQTGEADDDVYTIEIEYNHNWEMLPVWELGGNPVLVDGWLMYKSFYSPALPYLDGVIYDYNLLQISKVKHAYPTHWKYVPKCNACDGRGQINDGESETGKSSCDVCKGIGYIKSPLRDYEMPIEGKFDPSTQLPNPPIGFVEPKTDILKFQREEVDKGNRDALEYLNIMIAGDAATGTETATGKLIDREEKHSFIMAISANEFRKLKGVINATGHMRYNIIGTNGTPEENFVAPPINEPMNFGIRSESELVQEIKTAREAGDKNGLKKLLREYYKLRFGNNSKAEKITNVIFFTDRVIDFTDEQVNIALATGRIAHYEAIVHDSIEVLLNQLEMAGTIDIEEDSLEDIKAAIVEAAKLLSKEIKPPIDRKNTILDAARARNGNGEVVV